MDRFRPSQLEVVSSPAEFIPNLKGFSDLIAAGQEDRPEEFEDEDEEEEEEEFENSDDDIEISEADILTGHFQKPQTHRRGRKRGVEYSKESQALIGEANVAYISREFDKAVELLSKVIQSEPRLPDAYETLGVVYEAMEMYHEALKIFVLAAFFSTKKDPKNWKDLYHKAMEVDNIEIAIYCLSRLRLFRSEKTEAISERAKLFLRQGNITKAYIDLKAANEIVPNDAEITKRYCSVSVMRDRKEEAIEVLEDYFKRFLYSLTSQEDSANGDDNPEWDEELIQYLAKLYLEEEIFDSVSEMIQTIHRKLPNIELSLQTLVLGGIADLKQGKHAQAEVVFQRLFQVVPDDYIDSFVQVVDNFISLEMFDKALEFLDHALDNLSTDFAQIIYRKALCLKLNNEFDQGLSFAEKAAKLEPENIEYCSLLSELLNLKGDSSMTLEVLRLRSTSEVSQSEYMTKRQKIEAAEADFPLNMSNIEYFKAQADTFSEKGEFQELVDQCFPPLIETIECIKNTPHIMRDSMRNPPEIFHSVTCLDFCLLVCKALNYFERFEQALSVLKIVLQATPPLDDLDLRQVLTDKLFELRFLALGIAFNMDDFELSADYFKQAALSHPDILYDNDAMNLLGNLMDKLQYAAKHRRWLARLLKSNPDSPQLLLLNGHAALLRKSYRKALECYENAHQLAPDEPVPTFFVGVASCLRVTNFFIENRHELAVQCFSTLFKCGKYWKSQGDSDKEIESWYNLGVAFQTLSLPHLAVRYYRKVLGKNRVLLRETAQNLSIIYLKSGNKSMARDLLYTFNIV